MIKTIFTWAARIIPALILLQTLFYKFTAALESVYIFEQLGMEPAGRIGIGIGELIAGIALLIPSFSWLGAVLAIGLMSGAIFFHLTKLGIAVQEDGGMLFVMALVVFVFSLITLWLHRKDIPVLGKRIK
jgi:putative oxidoreductase